MDPPEEDSQTQPMTQPLADARRDGHGNSGIKEEDVSDIICILHPASVPAHQAVAKTAQNNAAHILQDYTSLGADLDQSSLDVALRLSSKVKDPSAGFSFGRNSDRCDILLTHENTELRISNVHFRIYLKQDGILMLQDTSTNGTIVDQNHVRRDGKYGTTSTQMLVPGSVITIMTKPASAVKFVVRVPPREGDVFDRFKQNVIKYFERIKGIRPSALDNDGFLVPQTQSHGMHWNGGVHYNVTGQLGKGAFATVYTLATKKDGQIFACKELDKRRMMQSRGRGGESIVDHEIRIMERLHHPNIVDLQDYYTHDNRWIYIIMEYVPAGELGTFVNEQGGRLSEALTQTIGKQVLHALHYLHAERITHRDIKPDNILISSVTPMRVKLSDFGLSKLVQEESFMKTFCGTLLYCAPEVYPEYDSYTVSGMRKRRRPGDPLPRTSPYDQSVDMWSFGAVLFHILCGIPPYMGRGDSRGSHMLRTIMTTTPNYGYLTAVGVSDVGVDFIRMLLNRNPSERPKEPELFRHAWFANVPDEFDYMDIPPFDEELPSSSLLEQVIEEEDEGVEIGQKPGESFINDFSQSSSDNVTPQQTMTKKAKLVVPNQNSPEAQAAVADPLPADVRYPSLPKQSYLESNSHFLSSPPERMFPKIPEVALKSSHLFGHESAGPPEVDQQGDEDQERHYRSNSDGPDTSYGSFDVPFYSNHSSPGWPCGNKLTGAEMMVDQLHVDSPNINDSFDANAGHVHPHPGSNVQESKPVDARSANDSRQYKQAPAIPPVLNNIDSDNELQTTSPAVFGYLKTLPGSIADFTIPLTTRLTPWGRGPDTYMPWPDPRDTRIPAYALEITFWTPAMHEISKNCNSNPNDWTTLPDLTAYLSTKARAGILINDTTTLRRADPARRVRLFGKLYDGDIVSVYKSSARGERLAFRCHFSVGRSMGPRPQAERPFVVQESRAMFEEEEAMAATSRSRKTKGKSDSNKDGSAGKGGQVGPSGWLIASGAVGLGMENMENKSTAVGSRREVWKENEVENDQRTDKGKEKA